MDKPITPTFAFGHGLSYTNFEYSDLAIDNSRINANGAVTISVTVRNTGKMAGDEVVQLYVRDPIASVARPVQELRGFKRVSLGVGEAMRVNFKLAAAQVALFGLDNQWRVEPGRIEVMIGASSTDIRARGAFEISNSAITSEPAAAILTTVTVSKLKN
jgi:beta-glucosidase